MRVQRNEWEIKPGRMPEARALLKEWAGLPKAPEFKRVYESAYMQFNVLAFEMEWESMAEEEKAWAAFFATPQFAALWKKWSELVVVGRQEIWSAVKM